ncbi:hypothetical protein [Embleya sp. MST-111070]|uniref:hypothetical protein n=1 Tax=Embleya sp. MST-111070 TaxID=3398231 RepID=UPI003F73F324
MCSRRTGCGTGTATTGTGWNATLLAHRVGPTGHVTTMEAAPTLAANARATLAGAGFADTTTVVHGDGTLGHPDTAPYDRVIATSEIERRVRALLAELAIEAA